MATILNGISRPTVTGVSQRFCSRRDFTITMLSPVAISMISACQLAQAEEKTEEMKNDGLLGGILSIFDPNETTKSGKKLPKSYLKAARDVVKNLREALQKDPANEQQKFREAANTAKDSIREYLTAWKGSKTVETQESYRELEKALRQLGTFYLKSGPTAKMPDDIKLQILQNLSDAEADL